MIAGEGEYIVDVRLGSELIQRVMAGEHLVWKRSAVTPLPGIDDSALAVYCSDSAEMTAELDEAVYRSETVAGHHELSIIPNKYLWICSEQRITSITSSGFEVPCLNFGTMSSEGRQWYVLRLCGRPQSDSIHFDLTI